MSEAYAHLQTELMSANKGAVTPPKPGGYTVVGTCPHGKPKTIMKAMEFVASREHGSVMQQLQAYIQQLNGRTDEQEFAEATEKSEKDGKREPASMK